MDVRPLDIPDAWVVTPVPHADDRGLLTEAYRAGPFVAAVGFAVAVAQVNVTLSRHAVVRGIHLVDVPPGQAKYVTCVAGAVMDVVVDVRVGSPAYGRWAAVRLDDVDRRAVYLAEGLGHAFVAVTPQATVTYLCSTPYDPSRERTITPLDPELGIDWSELGAGPLEPVLSARDRSAPSLAAAAAAGILPDYTRCRTLYATRLSGGGPAPAARSRRRTTGQ